MIKNKVFLILLIIPFVFLFIQNTVNKIEDEYRNNFFVDKKEIILDSLKFQTSGQLNFCDVTFYPPFFIVHNSDGSYLIVVDLMGNIFINSSISFNTNPSQTGWKNAFIIRNSAGNIIYAFNSSIGQMSGSISKGNTSFPTVSNSLVIRNSTHILVMFKDGNIYARGEAVYNYAPELCYDYVQCSNCQKASQYYCYYCYKGTCISYCSSKRDSPNCTHICTQ